MTEKTIDQLETEIVRDFATKKDLGKVEGKLDELNIVVKDQSLQTALLEQQLKSIDGTLHEIRDDLRRNVTRFIWTIVTPVLGSVGIAALYFLLLQAGLV